MANNSQSDTTPEIPGQDATSALPRCPRCFSGRVEIETFRHILGGYGAEGRCTDCDYIVGPEEIEPTYTEFQAMREGLKHFASETAPQDTRNGGDE